MSKVAGFIIGAIEVGIGIVTGNVALIIQGGMTIAAQAIVDLTAPKTPAREASEMTIKLGETSRSMEVGETFSSGSLVDGFNYGGKYGTDWEVLIIRLADHKCHSLTGFYVNDEWNPYTGDGLVPRYDDQLKIFFRADTTVDPLPTIVLDNGPGWTAADIGQSGCDVIVAYKADKAKDKHPGWPGGRPHFGFVLKGKLCYDLRKDDTVAGGAGPHRWTDPSTWEWSENAIVCWSNYERGVYADDDVTDPTKLLVGRGLTADELPPDDLVIAAANLCDEVAASVQPTREVVTQQAPGESNFFFSPSGDRMVYVDEGGSTLEWWDVATRSRLGASPSAGTLVTTVGEVSLGADGVAWFAGILLPGGNVWLFSCTQLGTPAPVLTDAPTATFIALTRAFATGTVSAFQTHSGYLDGIVYMPMTASLRDACVDDAGHRWALFQPGGTSNDFTLTDLDGSSSYTIVGAVSRSAFSAARLCYVASIGRFAVYSDGHFYSISKATGAVISTSVVSWTPHFVQLATDRTSFWDGMTEYSLADGSLIRALVQSDWGVASASHHAYEPVNNAIWAREAGPTTYIVAVMLLDRHGGYRVAGPIYSSQPFLDVEHMFEAATAGSILTREGSVFIEPGQAKSVVATFTDADLVAGTKASWNQGFLSESSSEWLNTVVATYVEPDQKWNSHSAPPMRVEADIIADGQPRESQVSLRLVRYQTQALRIAEIARRKGRLWGRGSVTLPRRFCELEDGDWVQWQSDGFFAGGTKTLRISAYGVSEKWQNTLTLEEIAASVFADDAVFSTDLSQPTMTPPPPDIGAPSAADWTLAPTTLVSSGASVPALALTGAVPVDENVGSVIVEYWKNDGITTPPTTAAADGVPWAMVGTYASDVSTIPIGSLTGGATYYVALTYVVSGIPGDRLVLGPKTIADLDVSAQVQPVVDALPWKRTVRAKTTAALATNTYVNGTAGVGATLTATANGALAAQDGVTLVANDRLLVDHEATGSRDGIYVVTQVGDGSHPYILTRATDANTGAKVVNATVKVSEGELFADQEWQCTNDATIIVGTTALVWALAGATAAVPQTLAPGATISWDLSLGFNAKVTLGAAANAFQAPVNPKEGITYRLELIQDGTGSRTATFAAAFDFGGAGTPTLSTVAAKHDFIFLDCYDPVTPKFRAAFNKGS